MADRKDEGPTGFAFPPMGPISTKWGIIIAVLLVGGGLAFALGIPFFN